MNKKIRSAFRSLKRSDPFWRYYSNLSPAAAYVLDGTKSISAAEKIALHELNANGIAITSMDDLMSDPALFQRLISETDALLRNRRSELRRFNDRASSIQTLGEKTFNYEMLGEEPRFDENNFFAHLALNSTFLNIANAYLRMRAKLRYYNVWYTFASDGKVRESQLWHFDREDNYILKVFLYLDDVDEGSGPFTYAPGTHRKGRFRSIKPEYFLEGGVRRSSDEQMKAVYPEDRWIRATGKRGTIIFADTRGYHKGGEARKKDRIVFTCMFTSPASESKSLIVFPEDLDLSSLTAKQVSALECK
jgi:hypothetical protein